MARIRSRKRVKELFAEIPMHRRAAFIKKLLDLSEQGLDDLLQDENARPRSKIEGARSAAQTVDYILGLWKHEYGQEDAAVKLLKAIAGGAESDGKRVTVNVIVPNDQAEPPTGEGDKGT